MDSQEPKLEEIAAFYEQDYYKNATTETKGPSRHLRKLAQSVAPKAGSLAADIGCGTGEWLMALQSSGLHVAGIDLSPKAVRICNDRLHGDFVVCGNGQQLCWKSEAFDFASCLGSLEHFPDKPQAIREMARIIKPGAQLLILVPNTNFIGSKLGLYKGTNQQSILETPLPISEWKQLLEGADLKIESIWKDTHLLSRDWIFMNGYFRGIFRAVIAVVLAMLPNPLQYQNYYLCSKPKHRS